MADTTNTIGEKAMMNTVHDHDHGTGLVSKEEPLLNPDSPDSTDTSDQTINQPPGEINGVPVSKWLMIRLYQRYNHSFLFALGLQYFNTGLVQAMLTLAISYMLLNVYKVSPAKN